MFLKWCDHCSSNYFLREILTMTMWWSIGFWSVDLAPPISGLTSALRFLGPCRQPCQESALSTSRSTLNDRTRVLQPPMIEAGSAHQWTITSPETPRAFNQLPLNPGLPVSRCHLHVRQGLATNLTGSQPLLSDQPLSLPNTTGPMWPHRQRPENTQLWRPEERALLRCTGCSHNRSLLQGQETSSTCQTHRNTNSKSGKRNRGTWSQRRNKKNPQKIKMKPR